MYKFCIIIALVATFVQADEEPFSIGLGVLSPSYSQTVGKENVKVNFEQKDNGFSYSVGDPASGTNTFLNFGSAAAGQAVNPAGYADANPSGYAGANPSAYAGANPSGYTGVNHAGANPSAYSGPSASSGYAGVNPSAYTGPSASSGYAGVNPSAYTGPSASSGYAGIQSNPSYSGLSGFQSPSYGAGASSGLGASGYATGNGLIGSAGHPGFYNGPAASPASASGYTGESARKPEETPSQILPAGFSYHGTEGQAFLRQGDSPNFVISDERQESARGPAEKSFYDNFRASGAEGSKKVLANGLVGYGPGGPRGNVPVGGFAGPQFSGVFREHGGHTAQDVDSYSG